jgi:hypothetical protein
VKATVEFLRKHPRPGRPTWRMCPDHAASWPPVVKGKAAAFDVIGDHECDACLVAEAQRLESEA